jgi:sugar (pentulose or hexulose) kinase
MLNSGLQAAWLKKFKPEIFKKVKSILHFPQYVSFLLTGRITAEHTSIGCHTALWDFDEMKYHDWVGDEGISLPVPAPVEQSHPASGIGSEVPVGIGIHDSSASLVPYFRHSSEEFILVSTGTWCISMNPFNHSPLTPSQLEQDCLAYMSIQQKPVKSSRLFLGHIHDVNVKRLAEFYGVAEDSYKSVHPDAKLLEKAHNSAQDGRYFFREGIPEDYIDTEASLETFADFGEAYHRLMLDLVGLTVESIGLITEPGKPPGNLFVTGGFARNAIFTGLLAAHFNDSRVYTSEIANATSLGAAMVQAHHFKDVSSEIDLGLQSIDALL